MYSPVLSIPARRASAWVAETDPKLARAWLNALPLADSAESAREIYQALYTLNRLELRAAVRFELMGMYDQAVSVVCNGLASRLALAIPPLPPRKRQLAEFIRRLHVEMAYGYKCCLRDLSRARLSLRRKARAAVCIERALYHLSEVLLCSYLVYVPYPIGVWREMHELYRVADSLGYGETPIESQEQGVPRQVTVGERYVRALLLGLINPYQLPHNAATQANVFLRQWGAHARLLAPGVERELKGAAGCFRVDPSADAPPVPLARETGSLQPEEWLLDARDLLALVQDFAARLRRGENIQRVGLGIDCLDSACLDLLARMVRAWGETARRRYARRQRSSSVFVCVGFNALHYFLAGQRPFAAFLEACMDQVRPRRTDQSSVAFVDLDGEDALREANEAHAAAPGGTESYRVERWRLRNVGPQGMAMARYDEVVTPIRVGELFGVQQPSDFGRWRVGAVRWVKAPEPQGVEAGIELLAPAASAVALRKPGAACDGAEAFAAVRLPATELVRRPPTLLLARGLCQAGDELELLDEESGLRRIRLLRLLERTGSFEQVVYGELTDGSRRASRPVR